MLSFMICIYFNSYNYGLNHNKMGKEDELQG